MIFLSNIFKIEYPPVTNTKLSVIARHKMFVKSEACCFIKSRGVLLNNSEPASVSNVVFIAFFIFMQDLWL